MINVGILGAANPDAGELIRLLVNHPDVELKLLFDETKTGRNVTYVHHGLIGEIDILFTEAENLESLDVLFLCFNKNQTQQFLSNYSVPESQYIIDFSDLYKSDDNSRFIYGLSELNRKPLVRGAHFASLPSSISVGILLSIIPLALQSNLNSDLSIEVFGGDECDDKLEKEVSLQLGKMGFNHNISIKQSLNESRRGIRIKTILKNDLPLDEVVSLYEMYYEDHNMTYVLGQSLDLKEVEGTDKCLISLDKVSDSIVVDTIIDGKLRGGAGDAVHVMNLFCGLHEKVGLSLKVINY